MSSESQSPPTRLTHLLELAEYADVIREEVHRVERKREREVGETPEGRRSLDVEREDLGDEYDGEVLQSVEPDGPMSPQKVSEEF